MERHEFIENILYNHRRSVISAYLLIIDASKIITCVKGSKWIETKTFSATQLLRLFAINLTRITSNIDITLNTDINRKLFIVMCCLQCCRI